MTIRPLTVLCSSFLLLLIGWNMGFPAFVYLELEAVAVNIASNEHVHLEDYDERIKLMHQVIDAKRAMRWPYFHLLLATSAANVAMVMLAFVFEFHSKLRAA